MKKVQPLGGCRPCQVLLPAEAIPDHTLEVAHQLAEAAWRSWLMLESAVARVLPALCSVSWKKFA